MKRITLGVLCFLLTSSLWAQSRTFTLDADFDEGTLVNVNHDAPNNNQLQLNQGTAAFPFVNIAASSRGTIIRIHTETGVITGEYFTSPDGQARNPSRTTVDQFGNVWVGNRNAFVNLTAVGSRGSLSRVGLVVGGTRTDAMGSADANGDYLMGPFDYNTCQDRDSDGLIKTSRGLADIRPWSNAGGADTQGGVSTADDECIVNYVIAGSPATRTIAIDADNNVIVGGTSSRLHEKVIVSGFNATRDPAFSVQFNCGGYGGFIDGNNVLWSMTSGGSYLRYDLNTSTGACINLTNYGTGIDPATGEVWISQLSGNPVHKVSPAGVLLGSFPHGNSNAQGVVVDGNGNVWVAHSLFSAGGVSRLKTNGTFIGNVVLPGGAGSTGVAVDAVGKVWVANINSNNAMRIDPNAGAIGADGITPIGAVDLTVNLGVGAGPYNYSDMTGSVIAGTTAPAGTWTVVYDGGAGGIVWGNVSWNGSTPANTSIMTEVRASNSQAGLAGEVFVPTNSGDPLAGIVGRFIQVRTTLARTAGAVSPVLFDLTVSAQQQNACIDPLTAPSYAGGYLLNAAGTRAFVRVVAPQGGTEFEFYNLTNLVVGDPETDTESGTPLPGLTRSGDTFSFSAGNEPPVAYFPIMRANPADSRVAFFLRVMDTCQRIVDVDPSFTLTDVAIDRLEGFALAPSAPNPTMNTATIRFSLDAPGNARLRIFDVLGREVATLVDEARAAGEHTVRFDGSSLPAGLYVYRLEASGRSLSRTLTLAR